MTFDALLEQMQKLPKVDEDDPEASHCRGDKILYQALLLLAMDHPEGKKVRGILEIYDSLTKWYT